MRSVNTFWLLGIALIASLAPTSQAATDPLQVVVAKAWESGPRRLRPSHGPSPVAFVRGETQFCTIVYDRGTRFPIRPGTSVRLKSMRGDRTEGFRLVLRDQRDRTVRVWLRPDLAREIAEADVDSMLAVLLLSDQRGEGLRAVGNKDSHLAQSPYCNHLPPSERREWLGLEDCKFPSGWRACEACYFDPPPIS